MAIEQVHIVDIHPAETLVETCHEVFPRAPVAVRPRPHVIASLGTDKELVAIRGEIITHQTAKGFLSTAVRRTVVVGEVEVGDAMVEGIASDGPAALKGIDSSEIVPES